VSETVFERIAELAVVPVIAIDRADAALPLADALIEGGLPVIEVTFRTAAAAEVISLLSRQRPQLLVGAGTILNEANLRAARDCGARFGVAPGLNPAIAGLAGEIGLPFVPGVATPSDVEGALALGLRQLKFFPSERLGGVAMIQALAGPYGHTGVKFVPTGGVNAGNLESYLGCPAVAAVGGTWLAKRDDLAAGNWDAVRQRCRAAVETVRRVRQAS